MIIIDDKISFFFWFVIVSKKRLISGLRNRAEKQIIIINKCVERMAVRGGLSPPPGPMNQIHYCHSIVKHTSIDSINKLIIQLKNESLSRFLL